MAREMIGENIITKKLISVASVDLKRRLEHTGILAAPAKRSKDNAAAAADIVASETDAGAAKAAHDTLKHFF